MPDIRDIIEIDDEKCTGCGLCVPACAEGALQIVDGKARLVGEVYCDGLGACLGECPEGALKVIKRQAEAFDEEAVEELLSGRESAGSDDSEPATPMPIFGGCPSARPKDLAPKPPETGHAAPAASGLGHWPVQLQLLSPDAPFLQGADLLLLADCVATAYPNLHSDLLPGRAVAMACPKLEDAQAHMNKLAALLAQAKPRSITVAVMEVPCCRGLEIIAREALKKAGLEMEIDKIMIGCDGRVLQKEQIPAGAVALG